MIKVSFIIPTLNAESVLEKCLYSISIQKFIRNNYEIIIADGGSTDNTIPIAKKYGSIILKNPLKTAEAGKAVGVKNSKGQYIALVDSDNILPNSDWLKNAIFPLEKDLDIIGTEPWKFTYRPSSGFMERYSALIGANDPYAFITGVYDRKSYINNKWTNLKVTTQNLPKYLKVSLFPNQAIPTIGANGTVFRSSFLKNNLNSNYLFDIDIISQVLKKEQKPIYFAKTKISIIHTFCESSYLKFIKKQKRRLTDYYVYQEQRSFDWTQTNKNSQLKFIFYTLLIFPALFDSIKGYLKKPDFVWFLHPIACLTTIYIYFIITIKYKLGFLKPINRQKWQQ